MEAALFSVHKTSLILTLGGRSYRKASVTENFPTLPQPPSGSHSFRSLGRSPLVHFLARSTIQRGFASSLLASMFLGNEKIVGVVSSRYFIES